jgi:hypothetical protein
MDTFVRTADVGIPVIRPALVPPSTSLKDRDPMGGEAHELSNTNVLSRLKCRKKGIQKITAET